MSEREIYIDAEQEPRRPRPRPPLIGEPPPPVGKRPRCPGCDRELKPYLRYVHEQEPDGTWQLGAKVRQWEGRYHGYGDFCGTQCAAEYAVRVVRILIPALHDSVRANIQAKLIRRR